MLTRLRIQNFKTFGERVEFELPSLTVLTGPNGAGKSSALESIGLFAQSTPIPEQPAQFRWSDRLVNLGANGQSAFHKPDQDLQLVLGIEIEAGDHLRAWLRKHNFDADLRAESIGYTVEHRRGTEEWRHHLHLDGELVATNATMALGRGVIKRGQGSFLEYHSRSALERMFTPAVCGNAVLAPKLFVGTRAIGGNEVDEATQHTFVGFGLYMSFLIACLKQKVFMLGPSRMPVREAPQAEAGPLSVGRRGERTVAVLSVLFAHPRHLAQARQIQHWAEIFGMGSLTSGWVREELLHAGYLDSDFDTPLGFESAGCGAQQVLPIITQIFAAPKNSLILIEEPEAGLHPESQAHLVRMFAEAVRLGHQLVVTTHSEALLEGLQSQFGVSTAGAPELSIYRLKKTQSGTTLQRHICVTPEHRNAVEAIDSRLPSVGLSHKAHA
ncbi:MAG TPA: AAA family ATPase [Terriglobales bacterium]|nr:AAA family ATPase [Terriglobales bacterium]